MSCERDGSCLQFRMLLHVVVGDMEGRTEEVEFKLRGISELHVP